MLKEEIPNVEFYDESFDREFSNPQRQNYSYIKRVLLNLALNHAVQIDQPQNTKKTSFSLSPKQDKKFSHTRTADEE